MVQRRVKGQPYSEYMKTYMRDYRKKERAMIQWARANQQFLVDLPRPLKPKGKK